MLSPLPGEVIKKIKNQGDESQVSGYVMRMTTGWNWSALGITQKRQMTT
jgi:hypothetical protein